ncbi:hypothetical protein AVEN_254176-1 [Araneus ventricosus]|uniref:Uncharacterized protein n=1 Tax=Araneus ventricosus TaxID=182803 RepID=A0A4Y2PZ01_ARAVE|nr:hypothetical protein AVEN_254176-1 [Araneus ventricosus]
MFLQYLSEMTDSPQFNAHINVEVCASVKSVKYLYKYVYKGDDAASVRFQSNDGLLNNDEILTFLDGRYVSAPEAMWRLNEFFLSEKSHVILRLAVHLPNQQKVVKESKVIIQLQNLMPSIDQCNGMYNKATSEKTTAYRY